MEPPEGQSLDSDQEGKRSSEPLPFGCRGRTRSGEEMPEGNRGSRARRATGASPIFDTPEARQSSHTAHGVEHLEVAYGHAPPHKHWRLELARAISKLGRHRSQAPEEEPFEELLALHRLRDDAQPHCRALERRDNAISGGLYRDREGREQLTREPLPLEQPAQLR